MKDIVGYEGLYAVTSCGKIYSYRRKKFLKPDINASGYLKVGLSKDGQRKKYFIHRLVAEAYIPNPEGLPQVNHKDENTENNCLQNLEWCDPKYNANYGTRNDKIKKPILQYDLEGNFIKEWPSTTDVGKEFIKGINHCLRGRQKTAYNYIWKYKEEDK